MIGVFEYKCRRCERRVEGIQMRGDSEQFDIICRALMHNNKPTMQNIMKGKKGSPPSLFCFHSCNDGISDGVGVADFIGYRLEEN